MISIDVSGDLTWELAGGGTLEGLASAVAGHWNGALFVAYLDREDLLGYSVIGAAESPNADEVRVHVEAMATAIDATEVWIASPSDPSSLPARMRADQPPGGPSATSGGRSTARENLSSPSP